MCMFIFFLLLFVDFIVQVVIFGFFVLFGGGLVYKQVQSICEWCFVDLVEQKIDFSCGVVVFVIILEKVYGVLFDEQVVIQGMFVYVDLEIVCIQGFFMFDMKCYVEFMGMCVCGYWIEVV